MGDFIVEIITKYGINGLVIAIIGGLIMFIILRTINKFGNNLTLTLSSDLDKLSLEMTKNITAQNDKLVNKISEQNSKLIDYFVNNTERTKDEHNKNLNKLMDMSQSLKQKCHELLDITHSSRVSILEFHNSSYNLNGMPFAKYTMTYEWPAKGVPTIQEFYRDMPFSIIANVYSDLMNSPNDYYIYYDIESMEDDNPVLCQTMKKRGTKSEAFFSIIDDNNQIIALLMIEFHTPLIKGTVSLQDVKDEVEKIKEMLVIQKGRY